MPIKAKVYGEMDIGLLEVGDMVRDAQRVLSDTAHSLKRSLKFLVASWDHKPLFEQSGPYAKGDSLYVDVGPGMFRDRDQVFLWLDQGTKPHVITPKARTTRRMRGGLPALRFKSKYRPKTAPGRMSSSRGGKSGRYRYRYRVNHPGIAPRNFMANLAERHQPWFERQVEALVYQYGSGIKARRIRKTFGTR